MADVQITTTDNGSAYPAGIRSVVTTASNTVYHFAENSTEDLVYKKSTDGGATWGSAVTIVNHTTFRKFAIWADWWTPGNTSSTINIWWLTVDGVSHAILDVSDDSLTSAVTVQSFGSMVASGSAHNTCVLDGVRTRGGNLIVAWAADDVGGNVLGIEKSTDDGTTWSAIATPWESTAIDRIILQPGAEADSNDIWAFFADVSADELDLKVYDDSGNSWATTNIATAMNINTFVATYQFDAAPVRGDNGSLVVAFSDGDTAGTDLRIWKVLSAASITELTNVLTDETDHIGCSIAVDQGSSDIYVFYGGSECDVFATALNVNYKKSTDDGSTWGAEQNFAASTGSHWEVWTDPSVGNPKAGMIIAAWVDTADSPNAIMTNADNAISITNASQVARISVAKV